MRIAYLHQYFTTPEMAGGTRSYEMARRLVAAGHEVHMVTSAREPEGGRKGWYETEVDGIHVHWLPVPYSNKMGYAARIKAFMSFAKAAGVKAATLRPELVFATSTPLTIAIPAVKAARRNKVPLVFEVRDLWPEMPIAAGALRNPLMVAAAKRLERWAYRNSAHVIALSPGMRDGVIRAGYPADQVTVVPNSCDLDLFAVGDGPGRALRATTPWLGDRPLIVYVGTLGLLNCVDYLARVAGAMREFDPEVQFAVLGAGGQEAVVRKAAEEAGVLGTSFHMVGEVRKKDVPAWLSAATVATSLFVPIPEMEANSANKFFDGLAAGKPVAINYGGWMADLLRESGAGLILDPKDHERAARQLHDLLHDEAKLKSAGEGAGRLARERFDRDLLFNDLHRVLTTAAKQR